MPSNNKSSYQLPHNYPIVDFFIINIFLFFVAGFVSQFLLLLLNM